MIELNSVRLFLPDDVLHQRIGSADPLVAYIKLLHKETESFWEKTGITNANGLFIVVGVKPGKKSRVWCEAVEGEIPVEILSRLENQLTGVASIIVKQDSIAFALEMRIAGRKPGKFPEMPKAWLEAAKKSRETLVVPDGLFKIIWQD